MRTHLQLPRLLLILASFSSWAWSEEPLRICADPNNLPFSNERQQGLENRLAQVLGREMHKPVVYVWWSERVRFVRQTLQAGRCDLILGLPEHTEGVLTTKPYYRSGYVFVYRHDRHFQLHSLDDPLLQRVRIGIHLTGKDYAPPAQYLARRGIFQNVIAYSLFGAYGEANPPAKLIDAVRRGEVDVAIAWGPLAGYFAHASPGPALDIVPIPERENSPAMPLLYDIAVAVRPGQDALKADVERALAARRGEIHQILKDFGVPTL